MDIKLKKKIARALANAIKVSDAMMWSMDNNEETRAVNLARSKSMEAIFQLGFDLTMDYKICKRGTS